MRDKLTASDIANAVSMTRSAHKGPIIVVEGVTDCRLYGKFAADGVRIVLAFSRDSVEKAVAEARSRGDLGVIGIMDADLDRLRGRRRSPPLFCPDGRDLEAMIMSSRALEDVLSEYADGERLEAFEARYGSARDALARASYPLGLLMLVSARDGLGLSFRDVDHSRFVDPRSLAADMGAMIDEVFSRSSQRAAGKAGLIERVEAEEELLDDPWDAIRGHDAVSVLLIGLSGAFGAYNCRSLGEGQLAGALRLAFGWEYFRETALYRDTRAWADAAGAALWVTR
ncbi:MAG: DUF4435 domain-containing protein [Candidatus Methanoplasma sp.]|jgi:hypothetical protein|nr:DUF4435 domain-containing protein [Candidatus Methanoplasma sp.]